MALITLNVHQKISAMYLLCSYCIVKHLLLLRWEMGEVRDRFGGMGRFRGERCKGWANSVITNVIIEIMYLM